MTTWRGRIRRLANLLGGPLGVEVVSTAVARRQFRESQLGHLMPALRHFGIELVVDVGANVGQFALELIEHGFDGRIVSVEPLPDAHAALAATAARHRQWQVHPRTALGADTREVRMQVAGNSVSSSVLPMLPAHERAAPESKALRSITVPQTTLDAAFADEARGARTLFKIDTQGYEQQVLAGGERCLERAVLVLLEMSVVALYEGQWLCDEAIHFMRQHGFEPWYQYPDFSDLESGRVLQYNGLFARRP